MRPARVERLGRAYPDLDNRGDHERESTMAREWRAERRVKVPVVGNFYPLETQGVWKSRVTFSERRSSHAGAPDSP